MITVRVQSNMLTLEERSMLSVIDRHRGDLVWGTFGYDWEDPVVVGEVNSGFGIADAVIVDRSNEIFLQPQRQVYFDREDQIRTLFLLSEHETFSITDISE